MRSLLRCLTCSALLCLSLSAVAQQDSLVVDETGFVGVNTSIPTESIVVSVAYQPPFVDVPRRCQRNVPVRIVIVDAATGAQLLSEQGFLTATSRLFTATLAPVGDTGMTVQVGVLTRASLTPCIVTEIAAVGPNGIRRIAPDG